MDKVKWRERERRHWQQSAVYLRITNSNGTLNVFPIGGYHANATGGSVGESRTYPGSHLRCARLLNWTTQQTADIEQREKRESRRTSTREMRWGGNTHLSIKIKFSAVRWLYAPPFISYTCSDEGPCSGISSVMRRESGLDSAPREGLPPLFLSLSLSAVQRQWYKSRRCPSALDAFTTARSLVLLLQFATVCSYSFIVSLLERGG